MPGCWTWGAGWLALALLWAAYAQADGRRVLDTGDLVREGTEQPSVLNVTTIRTSRALEGSPLIAAARNGDLNSVRSLIEGGNNVDEMIDNITALWIAAAFGRGTVVDFLLGAGAAIDVMGPGGLTPLLAAAEAGFESVIASLADNGANIEAQNIIGCTPLLLAAIGSHPRVAKVLTAMGANVDARQESGITPLFAAAYIGNFYMVKILLNAKASVDIPDIKNATPLFVAAQEGHELVVHELLQSKSYPDTPRIDGATPLHAAAAGCHKGIIELLLGGNANLESADASNRAPVDLVKREKCDDEYTLYTVEALLRPLFLAAREGDSWGASRLIENGRAVNSFLLSNGMTPLHIAASHVRVAVAKVLIDNGATKDARNTAGARPIDVLGIERQAEAKDISELTQLLTSAAARIPEPIQVLPPPTAASVQGVRTQTEKNGSTYDQVLIIACLISVVAAIIFSVTCFLGIRFGCRWRKDENVEFAQTSQKLYPNHPSSASSHQTACGQRQGSDSLCGEYRNPLHGSRASSKSQRHPGFVCGVYRESPQCLRSSSVSREGQSAEGSQRRQMYDDCSTCGSSYCTSASGRAYVEYSGKSPQRQQQFDHASKCGSPFFKRLSCRTNSGKSAGGSSRQLTPTGDYCEGSSYHPRIPDRVGSRQAPEGPQRNLYPVDFATHESPHHQNFLDKNSNRRSAGYSHRRQQSDNCFLRGSLDYSRQRGNGASSVPLGERRTSSRMCGHGPETGPNNARANVDLEDPIHSKLEKAIDFHDDSEENRT